MLCHEILKCDKCQPFQFQALIPTLPTDLVFFMFYHKITTD